MKKRKKKLALHRETLRQLERKELGDVAGASGNLWVTGCVCTVGCAATCGCGTGGTGSCGCGGTNTCQYPDSFCA
ncbi:MAG: hypothetical protein AAF657_40860 [Acidobacteriota bacterium]